MRRNTTLALLAALGVAAAAQAGTVTIFVASAPSSLAGYTTDTFTATDSDVTEKLVGFDFVGNGSTRGFFGQMNQVNPFGLSTVFADNNAVIPVVGAQVDQDSQFKVLTAGNVFVNASESATKLQAAFAYTAANAALATNVWTFAQIVRRSSFGGLQYTGAFTVHPTSGNEFLATVSGVTCLECVGPNVVDAEINNVNANVPGTLMHTFALQLPVGGTWSDFQFDSYLPAPGASGTGPATPATFDPSTHKVTWNTVGSPLGTYKWLVTATNPFGSDQGSLTVHITAVPEPATLSLIGLVMVGCAGLNRRRVA